MPFVGTGHMWLLGILLVIVLIIWGPGKLPDVGAGMGRAVREFRKQHIDFTCVRLDWISQYQFNTANERFDPFFVHVRNPHTVL